MSVHAQTNAIHYLRTRWTGLVPLLAGIVLIALLSEAVDARVQGLRTVEGSLDRAGYVYYNSSRGLRLMILHDVTDLTLDSGAADTAGSVRWFSGRGSKDGRPLFDWELQIADGKSARFRIDGSTYDLNYGSVFLVRSTPTGIEVRQLERDLSATTADRQGVARFVALDPIVHDFARGIADREARR